MPIGSLPTKLGCNMVTITLKDLPAGVQFEHVCNALATLRRYELITAEESMAMKFRFLANHPDLRAALEKAI